jgi:hypothetical protein
VFNRGVGARVEQDFVSIVFPSDDIGRTTVLPANRKDFTVAVGLVDVMALHDDSITNTGLHLVFSFVGLFKECASYAGSGRAGRP